MSKQCEDYVRSLSLGNFAAGLGEPGSAARLIGALPPSMLQTPSGQAFRLAMVLHARTQDDFYPTGRVHIGALALATCLALAGQAQSQLLVAIGAVYEVMCAVSAAYSQEAQLRGQRPSGVFGPLGTAAGAAVVLGLDEDGIANAIGLASTMSSGTNQTWISGSDEWLFEVGAAARAGVEAATFAASGARASSVALEGPAGWAKAFFDDPGARHLVAILDKSESRVPAVAHKPYPVSGIAEVPTWLACEVHRRLDGHPPERAVIYLSESEARYPGSGNRGPFHSRSDALMSVPNCVACGLLDGVVRLCRLEASNAPELATIRGTVELVGDSTLNETQSLLTVASGSHEIEIRGNGAAILYPSFEETIRDLDQLAHRTEAQPEQLEECAVQLSRPLPDWRALAELMGVTR